MGTTDFLHELTYDQLCFARDYAQKLIDAKNSEIKKIVWQVSDGYLVYENFRENEFLKAAEFLLKKARSIHEKGIDQHKLELSRIRVVESEYEQYFE